MVRLYLCEACRSDNHKKCERGHPAPPGHYGGSKCMCHCDGNPKFNDPEQIHKDLMETLRKLSEFEEKSRAAISSPKNKKRKAK